MESAWDKVQYVWNHLRAPAKGALLLLGAAMCWLLVRGIDYSPEVTGAANVSMIGIIVMFAAMALIGILREFGVMLVYCAVFVVFCHLVVTPVWEAVTTCAQHQTHTDAPLAP